MKVFHEIGPTMFTVLQNAPGLEAFIQYVIRAINICDMNRYNRIWHMNVVNLVTILYQYWNINDSCVQTVYPLGNQSTVNSNKKVKRGFPEVLKYIKLPSSFRLSFSSELSTSRIAVINLFANGIPKEEGIKKEERYIAEWFSLLLKWIQLHFNVRVRINKAINSKLYECCLLDRWLPEIFLSLLELVNNMTGSHWL